MFNGLRRCVVDFDGEKVECLFHCWTTGEKLIIRGREREILNVPMGIVELANGEVREAQLRTIKFTEGTIEQFKEARESLIQRMFGMERSEAESKYPSAFNPSIRIRYDEEVEKDVETPGRCADLQSGK